MKTNDYQFQYAMPSTIHEGKYDDGIVYIAKELQIIVLKCPCGCGEVIMLNTMEGVKPRWIIEGITIKPSINRIDGCKSHFSIVDGKVE